MRKLFFVFVLVPLAGCATVKKSEQKSDLDVLVQSKPSIECPTVTCVQADCSDYKKALIRCQDQLFDCNMAGRDK